MVISCTGACASTPVAGQPHPLLQAGGYPPKPEFKAYLPPLQVLHPVAVPGHYDSKVEMVFLLDMVLFGGRLHHIIPSHHGN